ncbi:hypothetical protein [Nocardia sp. NPDC050435]|uniref:hypothetical protein n=1 Tax=Nocardia sp. NPDC050435 TaxID=3155040 RepID=UPI0033EC2F1A
MSLRGLCRRVGIDYYSLCQRKYTKTLWVPGSDIRIGKRQGFSKHVSQLWIPGEPPFERPPTVDYLGAQQMARLRDISAARWWALVHAGDVDRPAVGIVDDLDDPEATEISGWEPPSTQPSTGSLP